MLVTITLGHHRSYIAFECRDRGRPVTIPDVEQFYEMCRKARVHNMVMVSSRGFAETAREEAANEYGIRCIDLNAVDSFDWLQTDALLCDRFIINRQLEWQLNAPDEA